MWPRVIIEKKKVHPCDKYEAFYLEYFHASIVSMNLI